MKKGISNFERNFVEPSQNSLYLRGQENKTEDSLFSKPGFTFPESHSSLSRALGSPAGPWAIPMHQCILLLCVLFSVHIKPGLSSPHPSHSPHSTLLLPQISPPFRNEQVSQEYPQNRAWQDSIRLDVPMHFYGSTSWGGHGHWLLCGCLPADWEHWWALSPRMFWNLGLFFKPSNSRPKAQVEAWRENFPGTGSGFLLHKHLHFELL